MRHIFQADFYIIFIDETIFKHIKLQDSHYTNYDFLHSHSVFLKNLNCAFLGNLSNSFYKLFALHCIKLPHSRKMFGGKRWNSFKCKIFFCRSKRISNRKNTRIKDSDNISGISFFNDFTFLCHQLLRL